MNFEKSHVFCAKKCGRPLDTLRPVVRNIFAPPVNKNYRFEVKNRCKSVEEAKTEHLLKLFSSF